MIELPEPALTTALHGPNPPKSGIEWRALAEKLIKEKQAAILSSLAVVTKNGQRATADSAKEIIFATEYDPTQGRAAHAPAVPEGITGGVMRRLRAAFARDSWDAAQRVPCI